MDQQEEVAPGEPDPPQGSAGIFDFAFCTGVVFCNTETEPEQDNAGPTRADAPPASRNVSRAYSSRSRSAPRSCGPAQAGTARLYQDVSLGDPRQPSVRQSGNEENGTSGPEENTPSPSGIALPARLTAVLVGYDNYQWAECPPGMPESEDLETIDIAVDPAAEEQSIIFPFPRKTWINYYAVVRAFGEAGEAMGYVSVGQGDDKWGEGTGHLRGSVSGSKFCRMFTHA